jgi:putative ABC transport system ATP-binding protein
MTTASTTPGLGSGGAGLPAPRAAADAATTAGGASAAETRDAVKAYGTGEATVRALDGVTVAFERGRFTAIMGPSGSGKSTLLHCLAGLDTLTSGDVRLGDQSLTGLKDKELTLLRRDRMGFVFQAFNLLPTLTAAENIRLPLDLAGRALDQDWFDTVVAAVGLTERLGHTPAQLSGGQQQRVAAARALVTRPEIVFADEPTGALDSKSGADLLAFLRRAVDEFGQTIVMVTHDPVAAAHADRVVFLADGRIRDELTAPTTVVVLDTMKRLGN